MFKICKQNDDYVISKLKQGIYDDIALCSNDFIENIVLSMDKLGILDCLTKSFNDKRKRNKIIPINLLMILSIVAKMKVHTSLTDIPYAINDHRLLSKIGYNLINSDIENKGIMTEGSIRFLINKFESNYFIDFYNDFVQNHVNKKLDIEPNIHILDCTKIKVNINNPNYENSSIAYDHNTNEPYRGYKLSVLRGIVDDIGIIEEIKFDTARIHDLALSEDMIMNTSCFHDGDILIMDRGFLSRDLMNYLKTKRSVDTYIPLRKNMEAYDMAVKVAIRNNEWNAHPNKKRDKQQIAFVTDLKDYWTGSNPNKDVDFNACVVWDKETNKYSVFITTDLSKSAREIVLTYELRPEIEEDFRQLKDFWKLEDFKSTKENFITFHIVCTLIGYLFFQLYRIFDNEGKQYIGKSLPCLIKNYNKNFLGYYVVYCDNFFTLLNYKKIINFILF